MADIRSVDVGTVSAIEDVKKLVRQDFRGVILTEMYTCSESSSKPSQPRLHPWTGGCK